MFDYVMALASVVIGLALTQLMQGVAGLIEAPGRVRIWWVHLIWVAYVTLTAILWWWYEFLLHSVPVWTFARYAFVLFYAFVIYLTAAVLCPRSCDGFATYEDYFMARRPWFFGLLIFTLLVDRVDTALKGWAHMMELGIEYWISGLFFIPLFIVGMISPRRWVQGGLAVLLLVYATSWAIRLFYTVQ
jgi:hypothetical protein